MSRSRSPGRSRCPSRFQTLERAYARPRQLRYRQAITSMPAQANVDFLRAPRGIRQGLGRCPRLQGRDIREEPLRSVRPAAMSPATVPTVTRIHGCTAFRRLRLGVSRKRYASAGASWAPTPGDHSPIINEPAHLQFRTRHLFGQPACATESSTVGWRGFGETDRLILHSGTCVWLRLSRSGRAKDAECQLHGADRDGAPSPSDPTTSATSMCIGESDAPHQSAKRGSLRMKSKLGCTLRSARYLSPP